MKFRWLITTLFMFTATQSFAMQLENNNVSVQDISHSKTQLEIQPIKINSQLNLVAKSLHENNATLTYQIDARIPQINGDVSRNPGISHFNSLIIEAANKHITDFKKDVVANANMLNSIDPSLRKNYLIITYDVNLLKPKDKQLVSVRLNIERMQAGHAHPYHSYAVFNFDLDSGKLLGLNDIFKSRSSYLKLLAAFTAPALKKQLQKDSWMVAEGTSPKPQNYQYWNFTKEGLLITFGEYQVAPYSSQPQQVKVPYQELKKVIKTSYVG